MSKRLAILAIMLFIFSGCSNSATEDENKGYEITDMLTSIGAMDNSETLDKQKFSYDITISNKERTEIKNIKIVLTDWIKQNQLENKITDLAFDTENITIKGHINFDTKGLTKEGIAKKLPFIEGLNVITDTGDTIFIKSFH